MSNLRWESDELVRVWTTDQPHLARVGEVRTLCGWDANFSLTQPDGVSVWRCFGCCSAASRLGLLWLGGTLRRREVGT